MAAPGLDLEILHWILWTECGKRNTVRVTQVDLAADLVVSKFVLNRALAELERQGAIKSVSAPGTKTGKLYEVTEPGERYGPGARVPTT